MNPFFKFLYWANHILCGVIMLYGAYLHITYRDDPDFWYYSDIPDWKLLFLFPIICIAASRLAKRVLERGVEGITPEMPKGPVHRSIEDLRKQLYNEEEEET